MELDSRLPDRLLKFKEVAVAIGVNVRTLRRWVEEKRFPQPDRTMYGVRKWSARRVLAWLELREWLELAIPADKQTMGQKRT